MSRTNQFFMPGEETTKLNSDSRTQHLQMPVILEGADFLTGAAAVLTGLLTDACLDTVAELELVDTGEAVEQEAVGFPTVAIERTGFALTNTGSVDGIGLPSLV